MLIIIIIIINTAPYLAGETVDINLFLQGLQHMLMGEATGRGHLLQPQTATQQIPAIFGRTARPLLRHLGADVDAVQVHVGYTGQALSTGALLNTHNMGIYNVNTQIYGLYGPGPQRWSCVEHTQKNMGYIMQIYKYTGYMGQALSTGALLTTHIMGIYIANTQIYMLYRPGAPRWSSVEHTKHWDTKCKYTNIQVILQKHI